MAAFQYLKGAYRKDGESSNRTRHNGFKRKEARFSLDIRNKFFTVRMVRHCNRLPRGVLHAPFLVVFQARVDGALSYLV